MRIRYAIACLAKQRAHSCQRVALSRHIVPSILPVNVCRDLGLDGRPDKLPHIGATSRSNVVVGMVEHHGRSPSGLATDLLRLGMDISPFLHCERALALGQEQPVAGRKGEHV